MFNPFHPTYTTRTRTVNRRTFDFTPVFFFFLLPLPNPINYIRTYNKYYIVVCSRQEIRETAKANVVLFSAIQLPSARRCGAHTFFSRHAFHNIQIRNPVIEIIIIIIIIFVIIVYFFILSKISLEINFKHLIRALYE